MTLNQFKLLYQDQLSSLYPENEIHSILQIVCEDLLNWTRADFLMNNREELNHLQEGILHKSLRELCTSKPVQYVTRTAHFYGHEFAVNEHTLIPRQETEELVHMIIMKVRQLLQCGETLYIFFHHLPRDGAVVKKDGVMLK